MYGLVGNKIAGSAPYHAAKGGVVNLTRALASEWGKYGITVNAIAAGMIDTKMNARFTVEEKAEFIGNLAIKRIGTPVDVANAALFLTGEGASYITGSILAVDGGM